MSRITAIVTGFHPTENFSCACGAHGDRAVLRRRSTGDAFVLCLACGELLADVAADIATLDPDDAEDTENSR